MFEFHWPWAAVLLLAPLLANRFWLRPPKDEEQSVEGERVTLLHPHVELLRASYRARKPGKPLATRLYRWLQYLLWAAIVVTLMQPQWLEPHTEVKTAGYDLLLAVDASHSMDALDFTVEGRQVTRMAVVKGVMGRFLDAREGDRIGLILFGSQAYVLSPLSVDRMAVRHLLDSVVPSIAGQGTALGDAIALGVKKLRERPPGSRVMILIADGDSNAGTFLPLEAARLAGYEGVRIYVIGVGSKDENIPILEEGAVKYRNDLTMDEDTLQQIAKLSGGAYFRATDTRALEEISRRINELEKTEVETRTALIPQPLYRWPLGLALACLLLVGLFPEGRKRFAKRVASA